MGESGLVHGDNDDQGDPGDDFQPLIERLTAPLPHQAAGGDGQQRLSRVHLGNNIHGGDLAVPAGKTWQIGGDVKIEGDAMLKIEDGATLQVNGHQATDGSGGQGHHQRLSQVRTQKKETPDILGALLTPPEPVRSQITLRIPAEGDPVAVERVRERLRREIDEAASGSLPLSARQEFAAQLRAETERQMQSNALALLTPVSEYLQEYLSTWGDPIRQALESSALSAAVAAQAAMHDAMQQALSPMALSMIEATKEMLRQQDKQIEQMRAAVATIGAQPFADLNLARHALTDLDTVRNALSMGGSGLGLLDDVNRTLRRGGYSLGLLDDVNQALSRREQRRRVRERHQAAEVRVSQAMVLVEVEPSAERQSPYAHLDYALQKGVWRPIGVLEKLLQYGDVRAYIAEMLESEPGPRQDDGNYPEEKVKEMWLAWLIADTKKRKELLEEWNIAPDGKYHYKLFRRYNLPLGRKKDTN